MAIIMEIEQLQRLKEDLAATGSPDDHRWWEYRCPKCNHHVASDIYHRQPLFCVRCGGDMVEVKKP